MRDLGRKYQQVEESNAAHYNPVIKTPDITECTCFDSGFVSRVHGQLSLLSLWSGLVLLVWLNVHQHDNGCVDVDH
jgi:hypothetical protein